MANGARIAAWILGVVSLTVGIQDADAQYMYLDANGDGVHTSADRLNANGTPTAVRVFLNTNTNRDGSPATCNTGDSPILNAFSYVVSLRAVNGAATYSGFTNQQAGMTVAFGEINTGNGEYKNGFGGPLPGVLGGPHLLASLSITGTGGSPSVQIVDLIAGSPDFTSFGTSCSGTAFDNTYRLDGPQTQALYGGPGDWFDADGLVPGAEPTAPPVLNPIGNKTVNEGSCLMFTATASDPDPGQTLTFSLGGGAPSGASITAAGSFTWCPTEAQGPGAYSVTVCVTDNGGVPQQDCETFTITVLEVNQAPVLAAIGNKSTCEAILLTFTATATEADIPANTLTFSLGAGAPAGATIHPNTGVFSWTPTEAQGPGSFPITVIVTDNGVPALNDTEAITATVVEGCQFAPVLAPIGNRTVNELALLNFIATATDADIPAQTLTFSLGAGAPAGAAITVAGAFTWTPTEAQGPGTFPITVIVTDNGFPPLSDTEMIQVQVNEVNAPPVLAAIGNKSGSVGTALTFTATATDSDIPAQALTFSLGAGAPAGATINATTGVFSWTPAASQGGLTHTVTILVTDNGNPPLSDSETITITVGPDPCSGILAAIGNKTVTEGSLLSFTATAFDPDPGQTPTFSLDAGAPVGAAITAGGNFTWTPAEAQGPGSYPITVRVTDPPCTDSETITVTVIEVNVAPVLTQPADMTVNQGAVETQQLTATDADLPANTLTFSMVSGPLFVTVSSSGVVSVAPGFADDGIHLVTARVSDGSLHDDGTFQVIVTGDGHPVADANGPYAGVTQVAVNFDGTGSSDPDGDVLTYEWDFGDGSTGTGASPMHTYTAVGVYNVTLTVCDGPVGDADRMCDSDATTATIVDFFAANVSVAGGNRNIRLGSGKPSWCAQIEADAGSYDPRDVDLASIRLLYGAGQIPAISGKTVIDGDKDRNGVAEITACFSKEALRTLFAGQPTGDYEVTVAGNLVTGGSFQGSVIVHVVNNGGFAASISPNPLNPRAKLTFATSEAGTVRVEMFDVQGRRVRTLMDEPNAPAGYHDVEIDGLDGLGRALASGVYYVKVLSRVDGSVTKAVTILK